MGPWSLSEFIMKKAKKNNFQGSLNKICMVHIKHLLNKLFKMKKKIKMDKKE
jgi:hypothetical protein